MVLTKHIDLKTRGNTDVIDITSKCKQFVRDSGLGDGLVTIFNPGSTGSISTIEYEPNLITDLKEALHCFAPADKTYHHRQTWHDDNGHSHMRSTIMGPSLSVPFVDGDLVLGTWQQIVFCDFDTSPRKRRLVVQIIGE